MAADAELLPAAHSIQTDEPLLGENVPATQSVHAAARSAENVPAPGEGQGGEARLYEVAGSRRRLF